MSCRSTSGGAVSTALARTVTGLPDRDIQKIFHALKREGVDTKPPTSYDLRAWASRQQDLLDRARRMSDAKRDGLRDRLFRARSEPTPDGATFYAWSRVEARARQEVAIRSIPEAIDLAPPGSQRHLYELDAEGKPAKVWYASYGSNLHRDRFLTYIKGGSPEGSTRFYDGCRDTTEPEADIAIRIPGARPHFALTSRVWHGGIAFIDAAKGETATGLGRAYEVSRSQFEDVVAQENGLSAGQCADIDYGAVIDSGRLVTGTGPYETLLHIGDHDGAPVLTFTAPFSTRDALGRAGQVNSTGTRMPVRTNRPSPAYLRMIGSGLNETFGMDEVAQADYLRGCPGGDRYDRKDIVHILRTPNSPPAPVTTTDFTWPHASYRSASNRYGRTGQDTSDDTRLPLFHDINGKPVYGKNSTPSSADVSSTSAVSGSGQSTAGGKTSGADNRQGEGTRESAAPRTPRPDDMAKNAIKQTVAAGATCEPDQRGILPGVKTYASGEDQRLGLRRWRAELRDAENTAKRLAWAVQWQQRQTSPPLHDVADVENRFNDAVARAAELRVKVRYAKNQKPATYYGASTRPRYEWEMIQRVQRGNVLVEQGSAARDQARLAQVEANNPDDGNLPKSAVAYRRQLRSAITAATNKAAKFQSRLDEAERALAELPPTPPITSDML